jgi:predicted DNA-binding transcriptional regulator AlpA
MTISKEDAAAAASKIAPSLAMSLQEFCSRHSISVSSFYVLEKKGLAPRIMKVGGRRLISTEEAARWREQHTVAA